MERDQGGGAYWRVWREEREVGNDVIIPKNKRGRYNYRI